MRAALLLCFFLLMASCIFAQQDIFCGTWITKGVDLNGETFNVEMKIATPEKQTLYPAELNIHYSKFNGTYQLLLVKKNNSRLEISRNKFALKEEPYSIGNWTVLLNGGFELGTDAMGTQTLSTARMPSKRYGVTLPAILNYEEANRSTVLSISELLKQVPLVLKKTDLQPWRNAAASKMLYSYETPAYFGLMDTFYTNEPKGLLNFSDNKKADNDSVSVMLNGRVIIEKMDISKPILSQEIILEPGENILCFFAENYGRVPPNTARLNLLFPDKKYMLDFTAKENISATFIAAKIYYSPDNKFKEPSETAARKNILEKIKLRPTKLIDSIKADAAEITLALWDDAVEDGDSISLQINDDIFMPGIAVKKKPQFIKVTLYPGENKIIFIADNLGSIPPNTSILELIDGKKRRSYMINTSFGQNNAIKILYDFKPQ